MKTTTTETIHAIIRCLETEILTAVEGSHERCEAQAELDDYCAELGRRGLD